MRWLIVLATVIATVSVAGAREAPAGTFEVSACGASLGAASHSWLPFNTDPAHLQTSDSCGAGDITGQSASTSGLAASDVLAVSTAALASGSAGWRFTAPSGDVVTAVELDRDLYFGLGGGWFPEVVDGTDVPLPGEVCSFDPAQASCEIQGRVAHAALSTSSLALQLVCDPAPYGQAGCSGGGPGLHVARVELNSATVTVTDNQPPSITATAGPLFSSTGYQHGPLVGTISGADNSGVSSVRVYVDGNKIAESAFACDFTYAEPCPGSATSSAMSLDTTRLADGPHQVQAAVIDAAGNETRGPVRQLLVANHPPSAPVGLAVTNAPSGWINHAATISWRSPPQGAGLPVAGVDWVTCAGVDATAPATGCGGVHSQATPTTSLTEDPRTEPAFGGRPGGYTVFVWLVDSSGDVNPAGAGRVSFGFDSTVPTMPLSVRALPSSNGRSFDVRATPPAHVAPIASVNWIACKAGGKCTLARNAPGHAFGFDPATNPTFKRAPRGRYAIRAWFEDAAGNASPSTARSISLTYPATVRPKTAKGAGDAFLRVRTASIVGRELRVSGTASRALHGHVRFVEHCRVGGGSRVLRRTATVVAGRFATSLVQPVGAQAERVTVIFDGDRHLRPETVTRALARS